jgi:hypothetical protein
MTEVPLTLTAEERAFLLRLLEAVLGETRVEVHHTHFSPEFREQVLREEKMVRGLLEKVRQRPS